MRLFRTTQIMILREIDFERMVQIQFWKHTEKMVVSTGGKVEICLFERVVEYLSITLTSDDLMNIR